MLDFGDIPRDRSVNSDVLTTAGTWVTWNKPRNIVMIDILCVGAGGGGGSAQNSGSLNMGATGGGGGSVGTLIIPASYLPDTLYIYVGRGGAGGGFSVKTGTVGESTVISTQPRSTGNDAIMICYGGNGGNPGSGTTSVAGAANTATPVIYSLGYGGITTLSQGPGSDATGASVIPSDRFYEDYRSLTCPGGAGAGGISNKGASLLTRQSFLSPVRGDGYTLWKPLVTIGGAGGNSSSGSAVSGMPGGTGGFGSGGGGGGVGGGGAGLFGFGGSGGQGFVIIKSW